MKIYTYSSKPRFESHKALGQVETQYTNTGILNKKLYLVLIICHLNIFIWSATFTANSRLSLYGLYLIPTTLGVVTLSLLKNI